MISSATRPSCSPRLHDWNTHKERLISDYQKGLSWKEILQRNRSYGLDVSKRSCQGHFAKWGVLKAFDERRKPLTPSFFTAEQPQQNPRADHEEFNTSVDCSGSKDTRFEQKFPRFQELLVLETQRALISPRLRVCCRTHASTRVPCYWCSAGYIHRVALSGTSLPINELEALITKLQPHINDEDRFENTPLHFLAASSRAEVRHFALFIRAGADPQRQNCYGETFLHVLKPDMEEDRLAELFCYLSSPVCGFNLAVRDIFGSTALHRLNEHGLSAKISSSLLQIAKHYGVRHDHRDCFGRTCDMVTEDIKRVKNIEIHLDFNSVIERLEEVNFGTLCCLDENIAQRSAILAMSKAVCEQHDEPIAEPRDYEGGLNRMAGFIERLNFDLNEEDEHGNNFLQCLLRAHYCSDVYRPIMELIMRGREHLEKLTNHVNRRGDTPLHTLVSLPYFKVDLALDLILKVILASFFQASELHFAIERRNYDGRTVLFEACIKGRTECVRILLAHNANPNIRDFMGHNILVACQMESARCLEQLQELDCHKIMTEELTEKLTDISECVKLIEKVTDFSECMKSTNEYLTKLPARYPGCFLHIQTSFG